MVKNSNIYPAVSKYLKAGLSIARIAKANGAELQSILEYYQMSLESLMHHFKIDEFVVTLGADGGFVQTKNGHTLRYAAEPVVSPLDPTGAGDVFFATYILTRVLKKKGIGEACRRGAHLAASQVAGTYITDDALVL
jgi:sugar/nucleoside kinase (ribokinase family)